MGQLEAIKARHSVRRYTDEPISESDRAALQEEVDRCNAEGHLGMRLVWDEPEAFSSAMAHYGRFRGVSNYLVLAGLESDDLEERCGYYGERVVLLAQQLGLNSCWVAMTFKRRHVRKMVNPDERLVLVVALGHGQDQGKERKSKSAKSIVFVPEDEEVPAWFECGVYTALLAPTARNQQKFHIVLLSEKNVHGKQFVRIKTQNAAYSDVDGGIVRLHFEIGAGADNFCWTN